LERITNRFSYRNISTTIDESCSCTVFSSNGVNDEEFLKDIFFPLIEGTSYANNSTDDVAP
jgi:hypothetical protein